MNTFNIKFLFLIVVFYVILLAGCRKGSYVQSLSDPDIITPPTTNIFLLIPPDSISFEEKVLAKNLRNEMINRGYKFTENIEDAEFILTLAIDKKEIPITYFERIGSHSFSFGNLGKSNFNLFQSDYTDVPVQGVEYHKNIVAGMYTAKELAEGKINQVWALFIGATLDDYNLGVKNLPKIISNFYFRDYNNQFFLEYPDYYY